MWIPCAWSDTGSRPLSGCPPLCQSRRRASLRGRGHGIVHGYPAMGSLGALRVFRVFVVRVRCFTWWQVEGPLLGSSLVLPRCCIHRSAPAHGVGAGLGRSHDLSSSCPFGSSKRQVGSSSALVFLTSPCPSSCHLACPFLFLEHAHTRCFQLD